MIYHKIAKQQLHLPSGDSCCFVASFKIPQKKPTYIGTVVTQCNDCVMDLVTALVMNQIKILRIKCFGCVFVWCAFISSESTATEKKCGYARIYVAFFH